jgi:hypothetical protein
MTEMKLSKVLKKDIIKHLGITPDRRRKDFKQFIAENGGYNNAIETLKSRLNIKPEFKEKTEVRKRQITVQKEYVERKRNPTARPKQPRKPRMSKKAIEKQKTIEKHNKSAKIIKDFYKTQKERNRLFTLNPSKIWNTKFSYTLVNHLPSSMKGFDPLTGEFKYLNVNDMIEVFQYYKIDKYLIKKLAEFKSGYKINIGFNITIHDIQAGIFYDYKEIFKSVIIFGKYDIYTYFEKVYAMFNYLCEEYNKGVVEIKEIYIDIYKTKPLNGSSYIALPEYIANEKQ